MPADPLTHGRCTGVKALCKDRLTGVAARTNIFDLRRGELLHRGQTDGVELAHIFRTQQPGICPASTNFVIDFGHK